MPTAKDMGLAKQLIAKNMISRAEMQRLLDELDDSRKAGRSISLDQHLIDNKVITRKELDFLLGSKKRVVHCSRCKTMYRAQEEDIGKRFKCKKCGMFVIVPEPGRTEAKPVSEIRKEVGGEQGKPALFEIDTQKFVSEHVIRQDAPGRPEKFAKRPASEAKESENTILLSLEDEVKSEDEPQPDSRKARDFDFRVSRDPDFRTPQETEATIMLDLDDEIEGDDDEEVMIVEDDLGEAGGVFELAEDEPESSPKQGGPDWSIGDNEEDAPLFLGEITPSFEQKSLSREEKKTLSEWAEEKAPAKRPEAKRPEAKRPEAKRPETKEPEVTIMLDLDDEDSDDAS